MKLCAGPLLVLLLLLLPPGALAQHPGLRPGDPLRALHAQLALANSVAIGTVDGVETGRIRIRDARPVLGDVAENFELKRAPSKPPRLRPGARILLLLRGARSPYLLVPTADEVVGLADAPAEDRWRRAIRDLASVRARPAALEDLYATWLSGRDDDLREAGSLGLRDSEASFRPLGSDRIGSLVKIAIDPSRPAPERRAAGRVAVSQLEGADALVAQLPGVPGEEDPVMLADVLKRAALLNSKQVGPALVRCLRHPDADVRRVALQLGSLLTRDDAASAMIENIAEDDPDPELREAASLIARRSKARAARRGGNAEAAGAPRASDGAGP